MINRRKKRFWWWPIDQRGMAQGGSALNLDQIDARVPLLILLALGQPLTTFFVTNAHWSFTRLMRDDLRQMNNFRFFFETTKSALCVVILSAWAFSILNISATFINEEVYLGTVILIAPLALKGKIRSRRRRGFSWLEKSMKNIFSILQKKIIKNLGARCLWRMNEYIIKCKKKYGESCRPSLFQTYMTAGQMLIYLKSLMDLGTPVEVKSIRWEADFLMRDFRKRIYLMFFPAIEGKD